MPEWINPTTVLFAVVVAALVALLWRQTGAIESLSGVGTRARDRERHDNHQLIQKLLEKLYARDAFAMARLHSIERLRTNQIDATTEKEASSGATPPTVETQKDEYVDEEVYEN